MLPDGTVRWIAANARGDDDENGRPVGMIGAAIDVTAARAADEALRESERRYHLLFDASPQIVEAFKGGWVQLTSDQQPFLQGYLPILSLCQQIVYGLSPMDVDTGAGFVTPENYEIVAKLAQEALR